MISLKNIISKKNEPAKPEAKDTKKQGNIFGQALNAGKAVKYKKAEYIDSKNKKIAYVRLGISFAALTAYSVFFFYGNTSAYLKAPAEIANLQGQISEYEEVILPSLE